MVPARVTPPALMPVSVAEAKRHCRIDFDDDDAFVAALIEAAVAHLDGWSGVLGRCLVNQQWRQVTCALMRTIRLPFPDVSSVVISYVDADDVTHTLEAEDYELLHDQRASLVRLRPSFAAPALADRGDAVQITVTAGYGATAADVPAAIRTAILMLVGHFYNNREAVGEPMAEVPLSVMALIAPYRRTGV